MITLPESATDVAAQQLSPTKKQPHSANLGRLPRSAACERCRNRKTRCTNEKPQCMPCVKAKAECVYPTIGTADDTSLLEYMQTLEQRLQHSGASVQLDRTVASISPAVPEDTQSSPQRPQPIPAIRYSSHPPAATSPSLVQWLVHRERADTTWSGQHSSTDTSPHAPPSTQLLDRLPISQNIPFPSQNQDARRRTFCADAEAERRRLPKGDRLMELVRRYVTYCNSAFHILHEPSLWQQVEIVLKAREVPQHDVFVVTMMIAIAISSTTRNQTRPRAVANAFYDQAREHLVNLNMSLGIPRLQALCLMTHYLMQNPDAGDVSEMAGAALRAAIDLGCHLDRASSRRPTPDPLSLDLRRRLFWFAYCVDVNISTAVGRPTGISIDWISAKFPTLASDIEITSAGVAHQFQPCRNKLAAHHLYRLRQMQNEITNALYSEAAGRRHVDTLWVETMQRRIDTWFDERIDLGVDSFINGNWLELNRNLTTESLNRPCPGNPSPSGDALQRALHASSSVMRLHKRMYRIGRINYAWLAIHHLYMSGVTFLACLTLGSSKGIALPPLVEAMLDIQACSGVLEALTAIQPGTAGFRDAFEEVSALVITAFSNPSRNMSRAQSIEPAGTGNLDGTPFMPVDLDHSYLPGAPPDDDAWEVLQSILFDPSNTFMNLQQIQPIDNGFLDSFPGIESTFSL